MRVMFNRLLLLVGLVTVAMTACAPKAVEAPKMPVPTSYRADVANEPNSTFLVDTAQGDLKTLAGRIGHPVGPDGTVATDVAATIWQGELLPSAGYSDRKAVEALDFSSDVAASAATCRGGASANIRDAKRSSAKSVISREIVAAGWNVENQWTQQFCQGNDPRPVIERLLLVEGDYQIETETSDAAKAAGGCTFGSAAFSMQVAGNVTNASELHAHVSGWVPGTIPSKEFCAKVRLQLQRECPKRGELDWPSCNGDWYMPGRSAADKVP
jgi:hypothetical protein